MNSRTSIPSLRSQDEEEKEELHLVIYPGEDGWKGVALVIQDFHLFVEAMRKDNEWLAKQTRPAVLE